jgi:glycosyltransferase involved in cell wall biosynthesis
MQRKHICILSLAMPIQNDPRTGRQIEQLLQDYHVTVIGFGQPYPAWNQITWRSINMEAHRVRRIWEMILLVLGRLFPALYGLYFWTRPRYRQCLHYALQANADAYHAADWAMLPIAVKAAQHHHARVVIDLDEYWTLFGESSRLWLLFFSPLIHRTFQQYAAAIHLAFTVSPPFQDIYQRTYGIQCELILNTPPFQTTSEHTTNPQSIKLIHHGACQRDRRLENLIEAIPLCDSRFSLYFLLGKADPQYLSELQTMAQLRAPGRVFFREMVVYEQVVATISDCDIEMCYMAPTTFTWRYTLPNKLFEAMMAGLAVVVGPSPAMAEIVRQYNIGWVADGFAPQDIARTLNAIQSEQLMNARARARQAAQTFNAESELAKVTAAYRKLFTPPSPQP